MTTPDPHRRGNTITPDPSNPAWMQDITLSLIARAQFIISGNIRDVILTYRSGRSLPLPLIESLWAAFSGYAFDYFLIHDRVDGISAYPDTPQAQARVTRDLDARFTDGHWTLALNDIPRVARRLAQHPDTRAALILDYASRLLLDPSHITPEEHDLFTALEKLSHHAHPLRIGQHNIYNPVIYLVDRPHDLPDYLTFGNEAIRFLSIPHPDLAARMQAAQMLAPSFLGFDPAHADLNEQRARDYANLTEGFTLRSMIAVSQLARTQGTPWANVSDAVRAFKVGVTHNPWRSNELRQNVANARRSIERRLKGQHQAITKTLDSLKRSIMGLTGAQAARETSRPRGILFFAGPTGVGKTELAKAITQVLFGNEQAYIRFDMSEFSQEHSDARLIGAPPGYVGFDAGGELTNAIRQRPFSVVLFDEIEKAHPRILDKFLQVLEDGRLTDGRGNTVYFSEAVIIFTSNLGIFVEDEHGERVQNVTPGTPYPEVERRVRESIEHYFKFTLSRPEILNRIGDNIIVFNFIEPDIGDLIFDKMLENIVQRVQDEHNLTVELDPRERDGLRQRCTEDLSNGGRGIGNRLETLFLNPLARALFAYDFQRGDTLHVTSIREEDNIQTVTLA